MSTWLELQLFFNVLHDFISRHLVLFILGFQVFIKQELVKVDLEPGKLSLCCCQPGPGLSSLLLDADVHTTRGGPNLAALQHKYASFFTTTESIYQAGHWKPLTWTIKIYQIFVKCIKSIEIIILYCQLGLPIFILPWLK